MKKTPVAVILVAFVICSVTAYYLSSLGSETKQPLTVQPSKCEKTGADYLIVADMQGFNDSVDHLRNHPNDPWPVIRAHKGDRISVIVCNLDDYSSHGFAIEHYFDQGIALMPHESYRITLTVQDTGSFRIYCNILCPVHVYMQNGELSVTG